MDAVWTNALYIGVSATSATPPVWTYARLGEGIEEIRFMPNEQARQDFFLSGEGYAHNAVTGAAPEIRVSGRRAVGDSAQDYIASLQFSVGAARESSVKLVSGGKQIVCPCTITDITAFGGQATDLNAFSCTLRLNGKPTVTSVA